MPSHGGTGYCDRPADDKGRTCKEIGAFRIWGKSKSTDEAFKVFRREYKKRFAWIKAGQITKGRVLRLEREGQGETG